MDTRTLIARIHITIVLQCLIGLFTAASAIAAEAPYPGPLAVHVTTLDGEGKTAPLGNVYVHVNARQAASNTAGIAILDGVPAGRHKLLIRHPGYETLERNIDLALGTRAQIEAPLTRAQPVVWRGTLLARGLDQPIAGVTIQIRPIEVRAALQGPGLATTDWDGTFEFVNLPPGRYTLTTAAPGFEPLAQEMRVKPADEGARAYADPRVDGVALDVCRHPGAECGKPAADVWCRAQGMGDSLDHRVRAKAPPTRSIGNKKLCEGEGCGRIEWLRCAAPAEMPKLSLTPITTPAKLKLTVTDAVSQRPLGRARITLAETWPDGVIAQGETDANGQVAFDALRSGAANWIDTNNRVAIARHRLTVRVEAEGHEPTVVPAALNTSVAVALNPLTAQPEAEPNDLGAPQDVRSGAPIRFAIASNTDHDTFRLRLPHPALLTAHVGPNNPVETHLRILDARAQLITENGAYSGNDNRIELRLAAGSYFAEVQEWGNNHSAPDKPMTLTLSAEPAVDPSEPNDTPAQAAPILSMQQVSGLIWPVGDRDVYRIEIKRPGLLRVREPAMGMERHVRILHADGRMVTEQGAYASQAIDLSAQTTPGSYLIEVREWGDNNASLTPYRLRVDHLPDDGVDDPPVTQGRMRAVRELSLGSNVYSTLLPNGDQDLYSIAIPAAGTLRIQSEGRLERHIQLFDRNGRLLTEQGVYANQVADRAWDLAGPDTVFLNIREWGDNNHSPSAYTLSVWLEPADEADFLQRNEGFDHATPLAPGDTTRGSYLPTGDRDVYLVEADFPGLLRVKARSAHETHLRIFDGKRKLMVEQGVYANNAAELAPQVAAGPYYVMLGEWGDNASSPAPYEMSVALERAEPAETWPLANDRARRLKDGEAQSFAIDHIGDVDRFLFEAGRAGKLTLSVSSPLEIVVSVYDDQTGARLHESGHYAPANPRIPLEFKNPARLRIELREWGDNNATLTPGFVMVDTQGRALAAERILAEPVAERPLSFNLKRQPVTGSERPGACELGLNRVDLNRDGRGELRLDSDQPRVWAFPEPGLYRVESLCTGHAGQTSRQPLWVQASAPRERKGVVLSLPVPIEGQTLDEPVELRAIAMSYDGKGIARVQFEVDGKHVGEDYTAPFQASLPWQALSAGEHSLRVTAWDTAGAKATLTRRFSLSDYFGLTPADGAVLSGERVRITWTSPGFGPSRVQYRKKGSEAWQTAIGENGRTHSVSLTGLEPGAAYEFQPLGGKEAGPVRSVTRVKGLAFSQARYGANIRRDYDQRIGISVRNNGDKPIKVRLECGKPKDPLLLVGFVGEGSEDKPIDLGPGEARQFMLGLSAQDVRSAAHSFPVRIVSDSGLSDEAEVAVQVQLPRVDLAWQDLGAVASGQGRTFRLSNRGDPVTDLEVSAADPDKVTISPTVRHGLLPAGQSRDFTVSPQYYEGFTGVETKLIARSLDQRFEQPYAMHLGPGETARQIWLFPGMDPAAASTKADEQQLIANATLANRLRPEEVDWGRRDNPEDTDHDGRMDRWSQTTGNVLWIGDDSDNDGAVDFVHADVGDDGVFEYSAFLENGRWQPTNLVEAWLEMGFNLPWSRGDYKAHDADIVLNGTVIGRLRDTIPEGNYAFRIPPGALKFDASGKPGDNQVGIRSKHLRGGHYVINSDFRFKFRLTATPVWTVAKSENEARANIASLSGISLFAPDFSITSADLRLSGPATPKAGDDMLLEILVRNLGSVPASDVPVTLRRPLASGGTEELARITVQHLALDGATLVRIPFKARGGANSLTVSIDPDNLYKDLDRANNTGVVFMQATGDTTAPTLKVTQPEDGQTLTDTFVALNATASDEQGIASLSLAIDGGLWQDLKPQDGSVNRALLLQPGTHRIEIRALDYSGNLASQKLQLRVEAKAPVIRVTAPVENASIDARSIEVRAEVPDDASVIGARSAGGAWHAGVRNGTQARIALPLGYGPQTIEVLVADRNGSATTAQVRVNGTRQPGEGEANRAQTTPDQGLLWPETHPELVIDLFKGTSGLFETADARIVPAAAQVQEDAPRPDPGKLGDAQDIRELPAAVAVEPLPQPPMPVVPVVQAPGPAQPPAPAVQERLVFEVGNSYGVSNKPTQPTVFTLSEAHVITLIQDYHWNAGRGAKPGTIALRDITGRLFGPWPVETSPGQGGVANAYWITHPMITLPSGTYTVVDSDPGSWSYNSQSGGSGFTRVEGYPTGRPDQPVSQPAPNATPPAAEPKKKMDGAKQLWKGLRDLLK